MSSSSKFLRVGTFNVRWADPNDGAHLWELRRARFLDFARAWGPDVLGLQEPVQSQFEQIQAGLPGYAAVGAGREDGREAGEFCPIFYRQERFELRRSGTFWFSDTPELPGSRSWGNWHPRICTWAHLRERSDGTGFYFYNLHWDNESGLARENSARLLRDRVRGRTTSDSTSSRDPVIVVGDFNAEAGEAAVDSLSAGDSPVPVSALRAVQPAPPGTMHGFTGDAPGTPIDHIFVSPEWQVEAASILYGDGKLPYPSDHFPVTATLSRRHG